MKDQIRIYYYFVIGAVGGLTGWLLSTLAASNAGQGIGGRILYGAILGALIGISVSAYDGISNRSLARFLKFGGIGLLLGATAGGIALPLAQAFYETLISAAQTGSGSKPDETLGVLKFLVGTLCWIFFGGLIGLGEGIGKGTQIWKGVLGGLLGGLLGGAVYEINRATSGAGGDLATDSFRPHFFLAISLALLGASVSASVAFVASALKNAWIEVVDGKLSGRTYDVTKYVDPKLGAVKSGIIGNDEWTSHIYLPGDNQILAHHAEISYANGAPTITVSAESNKRQSTFLNGRRLTHSSPLTNGDRIQVGSTSLIYRHKK